MDLGTAMFWSAVTGSAMPLGALLALWLPFTIAAAGFAGALLLAAGA